MTVTVDTSNLTSALGLAQEYSNRTPEVAVATAGFFVARATVLDTHRATISGIDVPLGVVSAVAISQRGARKGLPLKRGRLKTTFPRLRTGLTVADKIILARMYPGSDVNVEENNRWASSKSIYGTGASFLANVRAAARKMVAGRHSSIAFLASTARAIVKQLEPFVSPRYRRNAPPDDQQVAAAQSSAITPKGEASVSSSGMQASMKGDLLIGVNGSPPNLNEPHNSAMLKYLPGPLQRSLDTEAAKTMAWTADQELKAMESKFRAKGVTII
jgi:hypothetical protein